MTPQQILWGATWGNNMAALEWWALVSLLAWLLRHHIGRHLAAWWDKHNGPHAVRRQRQAMAEHEAAKRVNGSEGQ